MAGGDFLEARSLEPPGAISEVEADRPVDRREVVAVAPDREEGERVRQRRGGGERQRARVVRVDLPEDLDGRVSVVGERQVVVDEVVRDALGVTYTELSSAPRTFSAVANRSSSSDSSHF